MPTPSPDVREAAERAHALVVEAIAAFEDQRVDAATDFALRAVAAGPDPVDSARLVEILRVIGKEDASAQLAERTLQTLQALAEKNREDAEALAEYGHLCLEIGHPDIAEQMLLQSVDMGTANDGRAELLLLHVLLERGEADRVVRIWEPFLNRTEEQARFVILLAKALAHFGFRPHAEMVMKVAEPLFARERGVYEETLANIRGVEGEMPQSEVAARIFDESAENYDENLKAIGNAGPTMIARMLHQLELPEDASLEVLDAGCGTGLCAPYVRPYAAHVHGCDVSVKMLQLCQQKRLYDFLVRTDLGSRATFPDGPFGLVVAGDVFVYFGELLAPFRNIADVMTPGAWFVFTVEDCAAGDAPQGHVQRPSGRHAHTRDYLVSVLAEAGFGAPEAEFTGVMRREFRSPVEGRVIAARKLATGAAPA